MATPVRYTSGISTYKPNHVLSNFPFVPSPNQTGVVTMEMTPYVGAAYTVTSTSSTVGAGIYNAVASALTPGYNGGVLSMAVTTASGGKAGIALTGNATTGMPVQFIPGNQVWFNCQVAMNAAMIGYYASNTSSLTAGDATTVARWGLMDNSDPTGTITNGIYFELPGTKNSTASALNLVIKNTGLTGSTVTTTINNVADMARPSGIFGNTSSFGGNPASALTTAGSTNKYTSVAVATAGNGYAQAPLIRTTGADAASPYAQLYCQIGSQAAQNTIPGNMGNLAGSYLYAPYITHVGGTGYTTFTNEVNHWIGLSLYYDGKGRLFVGVNGRLVATVGIQQNQYTSSNVTNLAAGGTATTGNQFYVTNSSMTTSIAPVLPSPGTFDLIMPMSPLCAAAGYSLNTNATNIMFLDQIQVGSESN